MSEPRSPLEQALNFVVFAPIGLALTVVEDFPELAEKGRARLQQRAATARVVGQFAVAEGRRRLQGPPARSPAATARPVPTNEPFDPSATAGMSSPPASQPTASPPLAPKPGATQARRVTKLRPTSAAPATPVAASRSVPASESLAIPGYDSLSASQVVQRLASLSGPELAAVRDYEAGTRGRRTILARVSQLQV